MNRFALRNLSLLTLAMVAGPAMVAQESTGQIVGTVKTKAGELLAGVEIRLTSPSLQGVRIVVTDAKGYFRAPLLPPGSYKLALTKPGYLGPKVEAEVGLGSVARQDITMAKAGEATATVEVVATASTVDKTDVKASTNITSEMMDVLPRTTRGMGTIALLAPGVTTNATGRVQLRGGQGTGNRFLLNGTDISDNAFGTTDGRSFFVDDSVQETQVILSPVNARYGGFTGGVIMAITKTGGNEFSGIMRSNITKTSWAALPPLGLRPTGAQPNPGIDNWNRTYSITFGGPVLKDRLWFNVSTKLDPPSTTASTWANPTTSASGLLTGDNVTGLTPAIAGHALSEPAYVTGAGGSYFQQTKFTFYEAKLTGAITPDHSVDFGGSYSKSAYQPRSYVSGSSATGGSFDPAVLNSGGFFEYKYYTLGYRGLITNTMNLELRASRKLQKSISGGDPANGDPIFARYGNGSRYQFNNGIFNSQDGGDNRNIDTITANLQWYTPQTSLGQHQIDVGFEVLRQTRKARNDQAPNNLRFHVWGRNADGTYRVAGYDSFPTASASIRATVDGRNYAWLYWSDGGTAKTDLDAFYANDVWTITPKWQVSMGLRYDQVKASDTFGMSTIKSSQISPRFKLTWDLMGDQAWLANFSTARYTAKLQDGFANQFSLAGNPWQEAYGWRGAAVWNAPYSQIANLANWDLSANGFRGVSAPIVNSIDKNTKSPYADEVSLSLRHSYTNGSYMSWTYAKRVFHKFFNDFTTVGGEIDVPLRAVPGVTSPSVATTWGNDDRLVRDYKSFEFEFMARFNSEWSLGGNYTYSILKGNGEGSEGQASTLSVTGDVIGDYEAVHAGAGRDFNYYAPYGYLAGDVPHRVNMHLDYIARSGGGSVFNASLLFNYNAGKAYSLSRTNLFEAFAQASAAGSPIATQYPNTYTHFFGPRGIGRFNDTFNFDLKVGLDIPIAFKLRYFLEVTAFNVFNHWQQGDWSVANTAGDGTMVTNAPMSGYAAQAWSASATNRTGFGTYGSANFVGGRSVVLSTGFKW